MLKITINCINICFIQKYVNIILIIVKKRVHNKYKVEPIFFYQVLRILKLIFIIIQQLIFQQLK